MGGVLFGGFPVLHGCAAEKMSWARGNVFISLCPFSLSFPLFSHFCLYVWLSTWKFFFLLFLCCSHEIRWDYRDGVSFVLFCVLGTRRKSEGLVRSSSSFLKFMLVKWG
jgi:hypothetical protein